jgi:hypothetical protein
VSGSDEASVGKTVARWQGGLYDADKVQGKDELWLLQTEGEPAPAEFTEIWRRRWALRVPFTDVTEWFRVSATCVVDGRQLTVDKITGDVLAVSSVQRGPDDFTRHHGMHGVDWDVYVGDFDRAEIRDLVVKRTDHLANWRSSTELAATLTVAQDMISRPTFHFGGNEYSPVPFPRHLPHDTVMLDPPKNLVVPITALDQWWMTALYAELDGHPVLIDSLSANRAQIVTDHDSQWSVARGFRPKPYPHTLFGERAWWTWVDVGALRAFRQERVDLLQRWRDRERPEA